MRTLILLLLLVPSLALALDTPTSYVRSNVDAVVAILTSPEYQDEATRTAEMQKIEKVVDGFQTQTDVHTFDLDFPPDFPPVWGDPERFKKSYFGDVKKDGKPVYFTGDGAVYDVNSAATAILNPPIENKRAVVNGQGTRIVDTSPAGVRLQPRPVIDERHISQIDSAFIHHPAAMNCFPVTHCCI